LQTVHRETNPRFYRLLEEFERRTGYAVLINTSFNVRGEPIVCSPEDAATDTDYLCIGNCLLAKAEQPARKGDGRLREFDRISLTCERWRLRDARQSARKHASSRRAADGQGALMQSGPRRDGLAQARR
jgi:Carbamoyltransferase C-terminus